MGTDEDDEVPGWFALIGFAVVAVPGLGVGVAKGGVGAVTTGGLTGLAAVGTYETKMGKRGKAEFGVSRPSRHSRWSWVVGRIVSVSLPLRG